MVVRDAECDSWPQPEKTFPVSWDQFHRDSRALAWRLHEAGPFDGDRLHHPRRAGAGGDGRARAQRAHHRDGLHRQLPRLQEPGRAEGDERRRAGDHLDARRRARACSIVDDLVDTGKTARVVRDILPAAHFATVYAKPMGRPLVDTFITEVSQDTWIYFPWDTGLAFVPPIKEGGD